MIYKVKHPDFGFLSLFLVMFVLQVSPLQPAVVQVSLTALKELYNILEPYYVK